MLRVGILQKKQVDPFSFGLRDLLRQQGYRVDILNARHICVDSRLLDYDVLILKSKQPHLLYAGLYAEANGVQVIPSADISYRIRHRVEVQYLQRSLDVPIPTFYVGYASQMGSQLVEADYPVIHKPLFGSASEAIEVLTGPERLQRLPHNDQIVFLQSYVQGLHYMSYFVGDRIFTFQKLPILSEPSPMMPIETPAPIRSLVQHWQHQLKLPFGDMDFVEESNTGRFYSVDPGTFPSFVQLSQPWQVVARAIVDCISNHG